MSTIKHRASFRIDQPVDVIFPLFNAEAEKLWVPGWDYENVMGSNDFFEDYIFLTKNQEHGSPDAIWLVKRYKPESYLIELYKVEPIDKVCIMTIVSKIIEDAITQVDVSCEYIGLSKKGNEFIEGYTSAEYEAFIGQWKEMLVSYFESKRG